MMGQIGQNRPLKKIGQERYKSQVGPDRVWKIFEQGGIKSPEAPIGFE